MNYSKNVRLWVRGILAAFITGCATAILSALGVTAADAAGASIGALTGKQLLVVTLSGGLVGVAAYLQRSPLPKWDDDTQPPFPTP